MQRISSEVSIVRPHMLGGGGKWYNHLESFIRVVDHRFSVF
jgi:hypothetical protein